MISANNITLSFGERVLFKDVSVRFTPGNCYGIIGANGSGKSTFMNILSGELEQDSGEIIISKGERLTFLRQDHFVFDDFTVLNAVIVGYKKLYDIMIKRETIYAKEDFSEEDGINAAELEGDFADLNGWEAASEASQMLAGLGIDEELQTKKMHELDGGQKIRVLLAQALFGNPDILLLDEPTNHLDLESITWLEDFLYKFNNTVIVVSHDRHFLNKVCTHVVDIDFGKIQMFVGNYDFWYMSSQLASKQKKDDKKKREDKIVELKSFIQRFSANASKSRQATSRKKLIDRLTIDDIKPSSRRFPYINFKPERECGKNILEISNVTHSIDGVPILKNLSLQVNKGDKIALVGSNHLAKTILFQIIVGEIEPDKGRYEWGVTIKKSYYPKENSSYFDNNYNLTEWLSQYATDPDETYIRSFLGRMLFSGEDGLKSVRVLSGGEKVRCMMAKIMQEGSNVLIFDEPTNHLDLEAITALNDGLIDFPEVIFMTSHDHQFVDTIANRIIEFTPFGIIDRYMQFDEYLNSNNVKALRDSMYKNHDHNRLTI